MSWRTPVSPSCLHNRWKLRETESGYQGSEPSAVLLNTNPFPASVIPQAAALACICAAWCASAARAVSSSAIRRAAWDFVSFSTRPSGPVTTPRLMATVRFAISTSLQRSATTSDRLAPVAADIMRKHASSGDVSAARRSTRATSALEGGLMSG